MGLRGARDALRLIGHAGDPFDRSPAQVVAKRLIPQRGMPSIAREGVHVPMLGAIFSHMTNTSGSHRAPEAAATGARPIRWDVILGL